MNEALMDWQATWRTVQKAAFVLPGAASGARLGREEVRRALPHREPFLLVDEITDLRAEAATGVFDVTHAAPILVGHFPNRPILPGVLQVEAVGQLGLLVLAQARGTPVEDGLALTEVLGARFSRAVVPGHAMTIVARVFEDGLFFVVVGQCLMDGEVCSAAAVRGLDE